MKKKITFFSALTLFLVPSFTMFSSVVINGNTIVEESTSHKVGELFTVGGVNYEITSVGSENTVCVAYKSDSPYGATVIVPETVNFDNQDYTVTDIDDGAFANNTTIATIDLPSTIKTLNKSMFEGTKYLRTLTLRSTELISLDDNIFETGVQKYGTLYVPLSLEDTYSEDYFWKGFKNIRAIEHSHIEADKYSFRDGDISYMVYYMNHGMKDVMVYSGRYEYTGDVVVPATVKHIDASAGEIEFAVTRIDNKGMGLNENLTSVVLSDNIETIGDYAFYKCPNLKSVKLGESLYEIGALAFQQTGLTEITIPKNVRLIEKKCFNGTALKKVVCESPQPPVLMEDVFDNPQEMELIVPKGCVESYENNINWGQFGKISDGTLDEYTDGFFMLNEDWFGHNNGSINYHSNDGKWYYNVFQEENEGVSLGVTSQFGTVYGDKMYIVSKQSGSGCLLAVCDAKTMKVENSFNNLLGGDGRAVVGINPNKLYVSTTKGIAILKDEKIENAVSGTTSGYGIMVYANNRVFAINLSLGSIDVIDAENDCVESTIQGNFGSIVMAKDGSLWATMLREKALTRIDSYTLETEMVELPNWMDTPTSWAWTAEAYSSSNVENKLYWKRNSSGEISNRVICFDVDTRTASYLYDFGDTNWEFYGGALRVDPSTGDVICGLFKAYASKDYTVYRVSNTGELLGDYPLDKKNYWFFAMPIFPDNHEPVVSTEMPSSILFGNGLETRTIDLSDMVTDEDNIDAAIATSIVGNTNSEAVSARVENGKLEIEALKLANTAEIELSFNSNGKIVNHTIFVDVPSGIEEIDSNSDLRIYPNPVADIMNLTSNDADAMTIFNADGKTVMQGVVTIGDNAINVQQLPAGVYFVKVGNNTIRMVKK